MGSDFSAEVINISAFRLDFGRGSSVLLDDELFVPRVQHNLLCMSKLLDLGLVIGFGQNNIIIIYFDKWLIDIYHSGLFCLGMNTARGFV